MQRADSARCGHRDRSVPSTWPATHNEFLCPSSSQAAFHGLQCPRPPIVLGQRQSTTGSAQHRYWFRDKSRNKYINTCIQVPRNIPNTPRNTVMRRLTTGIHSEKQVVRRFRRCAKVRVRHKPRYYSLLHT